MAQVVFNKLLREMQREEVLADARSYNAVLGAASRALLWELCTMLLQVMEQKSVEPDVVSVGAKLEKAGLGEINFCTNLAANTRHKSGPK